MEEKNNEQQRIVAREDLREVKKILDEIGVKFWLMYGTLLGAIREKDLILTDHDVDLAMNFNDIGKEFLPILIKKLEERGFKSFTRSVQDVDDRLQKIDIIKGSWVISLFTLLLMGEPKGNQGLWWFVEKRGDYYYRIDPLFTEYFLEFKEIDFLGERFLVPNKAEELLIHWYGLDWKTPRNEGARLPIEKWIKSFKDYETNNN